MMKHAHKEPDILTVNGLSVGYGRKAVLKGVSFNLEAGRFLSLLGPNGAGKTTLLRAMSKLIPVMEGGISIAGRDFKEIAQAELARIQAVVLTDRLNPGMLTAYEVAALGRHPHTGFFGRLGPEDHRAVNRALEMVGGGDLAQRYFTQLSDGEKQKIVLARALAQEPSLILLDEPTVHLDLKHRLEVMTILRSLCRDMNLAVIASLHDVDVASRVSDQVALVAGGGLAGFGPPETILNERTVTKLYHLNGARYDSRLGVIELAGSNRRGPVFVLAGAGAAAAILRLLHKRDYAIMCGMVHQGDIDAHIARALGAELVTVAEFDNEPAQAMKQCRQMISRSEAVIDSGFSISGNSGHNTSLIKEAVGQGKPVFSLRSRSGQGVFDGIDAKQVVFCSDELDLAAQLSAFLNGRAGQESGAAD